MMSAQQTRRIVLTAAASLPAIIATPLKAETYTQPSDGELRRRAARDFIDLVANWHPRGRMVASYAMAMDLDPEDCEGIFLVDKDEPRREPILHFRQARRPHIQIVINALGAFEHGPVL